MNPEGGIALMLVAVAIASTLPPSGPAVSSARTVPHGTMGPVSGVVDSSVANFSASLQRLVTLVGSAGGAILALVWTRVALSWFSNDVTKKVQAKDRARDALVGTLIFGAALSGLIWGLAEWVLTGR
jgi:hypothetical protein